MTFWNAQSVFFPHGPVVWTCRTQLPVTVGAITIFFDQQLKVRPALYLPATTVFYSSQNRRVTEVMSGDRQWCHRSIRRNYHTCGPSVVKHRVSRDICTISYSAAALHLLVSFQQHTLNIYFKIYKQHVRCTTVFGSGCVQLHCVCRYEGRLSVVNCKWEVTER